MAHLTESTFAKAVPSCGDTLRENYTHEFSGSYSINGGVVAAPIVDVGHGFGHRRLTLRNIYAPYSAWDIANPTFRKGITDVVIEDSWGYNFFVYSNPDRLVFRRCRIDENSAVKAVNSGAEPYVKLHSFKSDDRSLQPDNRYEGYVKEVTFESCNLRGVRQNSGLISVDFWPEYSGDPRYLPKFDTINIGGNSNFSLSVLGASNSIVQVGNVIGGLGNLNISGPPNMATNVNSLIFDPGGVGRGISLTYSKDGLNIVQSVVNVAMNFTRVISSPIKPILLATQTTAPPVIPLGVISGTNCSPVLSQPIADSPIPANFSGTVTFNRTS